MGITKYTRKKSKEDSDIVNQAYKEYKKAKEAAREAQQKYKMYEDVGK